MHTSHCALREYRSLSSSISLATLVFIIVPIHFILLEATYTRFDTPQSFASWMAAVCSALIKLSFDPLQCYQPHCFITLRHYHYNDGKYIIMYNPQKLCNYCRNSPK